MRILIGPTNRNQGNVLLVTLLSCFVIGFGLASYLVLVSDQNLSVMRSLAWNATVPILEAGAEEALTQIHYHGVTNLSANGWVYTSSKYGAAYYKKRVLGDSYFEAYIRPTDPPIVFTEGYVPVPLRPSQQVGMILASLYAGEDRSTPKDYVRRGVRLTTKRDALWAKAMVAEGQIDLLGRNIMTDSFNSTNALLNTNGKYDPAKTSDKGDVATNSGLTNSLNIGNAKIKGHVATGAGGSMSLGPQGSAGSKAWVESNQKGVQPTWGSDDMNVQFAKVKEPKASFSTPSGGTVGGVYYNYILTNGAYLIKNLESSKVLVTGNAMLYVTDTLKFAGQDVIRIQSGASLAMYVAAPEAYIGGNGVINENGSALAFQYYGLPSNTSLQYAGNGTFTGVVYAPDAAFQLGGGGNDVYDFIGASITKTVYMNGHYRFHYDEALDGLGPARDYIVTSWNEI
jgi:hypothetical protein